MLKDDTWRESARCAEPWFKREVHAFLGGNFRDTSQAFYPITQDDEGQPLDAGSNPTLKARQDSLRGLARKACGECPVRMDCLFMALEHDVVPFGIHGGLDEQGQMDIMDNPEAKILQCHCICGTRVYGTPKASRKHCSAACERREKRERQAAKQSATR